MLYENFKSKNNEDNETKEKEDIYFFLHVLYLFIYLFVI